MNRVSRFVRMLGTVFIVMSVICPASSFLCAQNASDEVNALVEKLDKGHLDEVKQALPDLVAKYQNDPGVTYLQGRVATNGIEAVKLYQSIVDNFPKDEWADDALYRIYQYYYAMGLYKTAELKLQQLRKAYPSSPFVTGKPQVMFPQKEEQSVRLPERKPIVDSVKTVAASDTTANDDSGNEKNEVVTSAERTTPPPAVSEKSEESVGRYTLQVGAFSTSVNAVKQKNFLEKKGYDVEMTNKVRNGKSLFLVWIGSFRTTDEASKVRKELKSKYKLDSMIVER